MMKERVEEYLGAIYRLRRDAETPLPLSELSAYFDFSPVSIHEMIQKLDQQGYVAYHPYRGVTLTAEGAAAAQALLRRHRLWERFLTDVLHIPWEDAHAFAGRLEHAAPEIVTEGLAELLGSPVVCPHGGPIPPRVTESKTSNSRTPVARSSRSGEQRLQDLPVGVPARVRRISPETSERLHRLRGWKMLPGCQVVVVAQQEDATVTEIAQHVVEVPYDDARAVWVEP